MSTVLLPTSGKSGSRGDSAAQLAKVVGRKAGFGFALLALAMSCQVGLLRSQDSVIFKIQHAQLTQMFGMLGSLGVSAAFPVAAEGYRLGQDPAQWVSAKTYQAAQLRKRDPAVRT